MQVAQVSEQPAGQTGVGDRVAGASRQIQQVAVDEIDVNAKSVLAYSGCGALIPLRSWPTSGSRVCSWLCSNVCCFAKLKRGTLRRENDKLRGYCLRTIVKKTRKAALSLGTQGLDQSNSLPSFGTRYRYILNYIGHSKYGLFQHTCCMSQ
jgi:hypothetical protein